MKVETQVIDGKTWIMFNNKFDKFKYYWGIYITVFLISFLVVLGLGLGYIFLSYIDLLQTNPCELCKGLGYECIKFRIGG